MLRARLYVTAALLAATTLMVRADAPTPERKQAAMDLLLVMKMDVVMDDMIKQMLDAQIQSNPDIARFRPQMEAFFAKYISWAALKDDLASIYAEEFTEDEMKEIGNFYKTPTGQKLAQKLPVLTTKGAQLGQQRVQQNMAELQQSIQNAAQTQPK